MDARFTPQTAASTLKTHRALASAEQQQCNVARGSLEATVDKLLAASRSLKNVLQQTHAETLLRTLLPAESQTLASRLRLPSPLGAAEETAVPPARLRNFLIAFGSLVTILRRQPVALVEAVHRSKTAAPLAVPLLVGSVWGHASWRRDEAESLVRAAAHAIGLCALERGSSSALAAGSLPERLACTLLRVLPGVSAWLQAALVPQILAIADASDHHSLVLSEEPDQLRTWCIALLKAVIALAPAAPAALRTLGKQLLQLGAAANNGGAAMLGADASWSLFVEIVVAMLLAPSIACPESYGLLVPAPLSKSTRSNLLQIASMLTRSATQQGSDEGGSRDPSPAIDITDCSGGVAAAAAAAAPSATSPAPSRYAERMSRARSANSSAGHAFISLPQPPSEAEAKGRV